MTHSRYNKKEWAFFGACSYLGALFISTIILWWAALAGGKPLTIPTSEVVDYRGMEIRSAKPGQAIGIRREVCSKQESGVKFFPTLKDEAGLLFPLPSGMLYLIEGCDVEIYGFIVPNLPPGTYQYQSAIQYQANLVGRDEAILTPSVTLVITHD